MVCPKCGNEMNVELLLKERKKDPVIAIVLFLYFIIPGIVYLFLPSSRKIKKYTCSECDYHKSVLVK